MGSTNGERLRLLTAAEVPLPALVETLLVELEALQAETLTREGFWNRVYDGAARGNEGMRELCRREAQWLAGHKNGVGRAHATGQQILTQLRTPPA